MIATTRDSGLSIGFVRDFIDENNTGDVKNVQIIHQPSFPVIFVKLSRVHNEI